MVSTVWLKYQIIDTYLQPLLSPQAPPYQSLVARSTTKNKKWRARESVQVVNYAET